MVISGGSSLPKEDIERMVREAEEHAAEDKARREAERGRNQAEQLVYSIEKLIKENDDKLPTDVKTEVQADVDALKSALAGDDDDAVKTAFDKLNESQGKLGQAIYSQPGRREPVPRAASSRPPSSRATTRTSSTPRSSTTRTTTQEVTMTDATNDDNVENNEEPSRSRGTPPTASASPRSRHRGERPTSSTDGRPPPTAGSDETTSARGRRPRRRALSGDEEAKSEPSRARPGRRDARGHAPRAGRAGELPQARRARPRSQPRGRIAEVVRALLPALDDLDPRRGARRPRRGHPMQVIGAEDPRRLREVRARARSARRASPSTRTSTRRSCSSRAPGVTGEHRGGRHRAGLRAR